MPDPEFRCYETSTLEMRGKPGEGAVLAGYPIVYNTRSQLLYWFYEQVAPGAFDDSAARDDVVANYDHDSAQMLARSIPLVGQNTLRLAPDEHGMKADIDMPDTDLAHRVYAHVDRGDLRGMSFAFRTIGESEDWWSETEEGFPLREIRKGRLFDVAVVVDPAYLDTEVQARAAARSLSMGSNLPLKELIPAFEQRSLLAAITELRSRPDFGRDQQTDTSQEDVRAEGSSAEGQQAEPVGAPTRELMAARLRLCEVGFYPTSQRSVP